MSPNSSNAAAHLRIDGVSISFAGRRVLTDIAFTVAAGERVGLIGENGSGKSTLLRVVAGLLHPDAGSTAVTAPGGVSPRIGLYHQEPPFAATDTVQQALDAAVRPALLAVDAIDRLGQAMAANSDDPSVADAYSAALDDAERLDAWDVDARMGRLLDALGLAGIRRDRATGSLSGGQRARLSLAWLLLSAPDVLLLDEPTNHLDDAAAEHLRSLLAMWRGPVLFASHDRAFLDETATSLIDLDPSPASHRVGEAADDPRSGDGVTRFTGGYTQYLAARTERRRRWEQQFRDEQEELRRLRDEVRGSHTVGHVGRAPRTEGKAAAKFYADRNARVVSRRVRDAQARLAELEREQVRKPPRPLVFAGLAAGAARGRASGRAGGGAASNWALAASEVGVSGRLAPVSIDVDRGSRWLITGPNGAGKSTLLGILSGRIIPEAGSIQRAPGITVAMLQQDVTLPDPYGRGQGRTVEQAYEDLVGAETAERAPLSTFGLIAGRDEHRAVGELSVGQRRRLALAVMLAEPPDVLLLDEPTNHLSLALATALEEAIPDYPGAVVVASHDRWLRRRWNAARLRLSATGGSAPSGDEACRVEDER